MAPVFWSCFSFSLLLVKERQLIIMSLTAEEGREKEDHWVTHTQIQRPQKAVSPSSWSLCMCVCMNRDNGVRSWVIHPIPFLGFKEGWGGIESMSLLCSWMSVCSRNFIYVEWVSEWLWASCSCCCCPIEIRRWDERRKTKSKMEKKRKTMGLHKWCPFSFMASLSLYCSLLLYLLLLFLHTQKKESLLRMKREVASKEEEKENVSIWEWGGKPSGWMNPSFRLSVWGLGWYLDLEAERPISMMSSSIIIIHDGVVW